MFGNRKKKGWKLENNFFCLLKVSGQMARVEVFMNLFNKFHNFFSGVQFFRFFADLSNQI